MSRTPSTVAALALAALCLPLTGALGLSQATATALPAHDLVPAIQRYTKVIHLESDSAMVPIPTSATGIGPGSHLIIDRPDGEFGCTANYVWQDSGGTLYLGAAGHCFLQPSIHEAVNPASVQVWVCVSACTFGGETGFIIQGNMVPLGPYIYARQQDAAGNQVGHDFGMVQIPTSRASLVRTQMPVWSGPSASGYIRADQVLVHYGCGVGVGEAWPTMARAGVAAFGDLQSWYAELAASPGDSGSAVSIASVNTANVVEGTVAGGILTHLSVGVSLPNAPGFVAGTQVPQAIAMVSADAGLTIGVKY